MKMEFEEALEKLEKIVREMESEEISLEASIKKYEEGTRLAGFCLKTLDAAEKKIEILRKSEESEGKEIQPFEDDGDETE